MSHWVFKVGMAVSIIGGALVTGGIVPLAFAGVFAATAAAAGLFHDKPGS